MDIRRILEVANKSSINFNTKIFVKDGQAYVTIDTFTTKVVDEDDVVNAIRGYVEDTLEDLV